MSKTFRWAMVLFLILVLAFGIWRFWGRTSEPVKIQAGVVAPVSMQEEVYATGNIVPAARQEVSALSQGRVAKTAVKAGDTVQAGQTLVTLDTTLADAQVAQAEANEEAAQTTVQAAQTNLDELQKAQSAAAAVGPGGAGGIGSQLPAGFSSQNSAVPVNPVSPASVVQAEGTLAQGQASLKQAQAALKVAQVQQGQLTYKAALAGTVLEINAQAGNPAPVQEPLVVVADLSRLNVTAQLNEVDAAKVRLNQKATVTSKVLGSGSIPGSVSQIAPEAVAQPSAQGAGSPTVGVKIQIAKVPAVLKPGSTVNIRIVVATKQGVLAVPLEALFQEGGKNYVYRIQGGSLHKTEVQVGIEDNVNQEITAGLKAGDVVVTNPASNLSEGLQVTPQIGGGSP